MNSQNQMQFCYQFDFSVGWARSLADHWYLASQVLCPSAPPCRQLSQEEVWTHQQPSPQEEAEVDSLSDLAESAILC